MSAVSFPLDERARAHAIQTHAHHRRIAVSRYHVAMCDGNAYDAMLLAQLVYWFSEPGRVTHTRDGKLWVVKTYDEWAGEIGITERTLKRSMGRLEAMGLVERRTHKSAYHDGKTALHTWFNWSTYAEELEAAVEDMLDPDEWKCLLGTSGEFLKGTTRNALEARPSYTETTTETTLSADADGAPANAETVAQEPVEQSKPKPKKATVPAAQMTPMKDAIAAAHGIDWKTATKTEIGTTQKAAKELIQAGVTPDEVPSLWAYCNRQGWGDGWKPVAVLNHVSAWRKSTTNAPRTMQYKTVEDNASLDALDQMRRPA